eukprot:scaffold1230_cov239-Pinguiococcus_pyrenoidosus.AAC.1
MPRASGEDAVPSVEAADVLRAFGGLSGRGFHWGTFCRLALSNLGLYLQSGNVLGLDLPPDFRHLCNDRSSSSIR